LESKKQLLSFFNKGLNNCLPHKLVKKTVNLKNNNLIIKNTAFNLNNYNNIYILGSGKASVDMAQGIEKVLKNKIKESVVVSNIKADTLMKTKVLLAQHPIPALQSFKSTKKFISYCKKVQTNDFFIFLLSGGSSAMVEMPVFNFSYREIQTLYKKLLISGMNIEEINTVRNCFSKTKGGGLLRFLKGTGVALVLSDVMSDNLQTIGSAPVFYTKNEFEKAKFLIKKHNIKLNNKFLLYLLKQQKLKKQHKTKQQIPHFIAGNNQTLLTEIKTQIENEGFLCFSYPNYLQGDVSIAGEKIANFLLKKLKTINQTTFFLFGGETTVKVKGNGVGGRNQELALHILGKLKNTKNIDLLSIATDGVDGNSVAAGAFINKKIYEKATKLNLKIDKYLKNNNSFHFFKQTNSVVITGKTNNNLLDIVIAKCSKKDFGNTD
jgi:hydroxypyruvate reductase/glycerate 2-kinase